MPNSELLDIVLIAVAGFLLFRLYTVLGRRTGHERPPEDRFRLQPNPEAPAAAPASDAKTQVLPGARAIDAKPADPVARGLLDVKLADRNFDAEHFLSGARHAYEIIVTGFEKGDRAALRPLLSEEVFRAFESAIAAREASKEPAGHNFVGVKDAKIVEACLKGRTADITVAFGAQFVAAPGGAMREVTDVWTFARDTKARDPNWTLIATSGELT